MSRRLTERSAAALAQPGRVSVRARRDAWRADFADPKSWHRCTFDRVVRDVEVHDEPVLLGEYHFEHARGVVRMPWGVEVVRAVSHSPISLYTQWELVTLRS